MNKKEFKKINVKPKSYDQLKWLSRILNKSMVSCFEELMDALTQESFKYKEGMANVEYKINDDDDIVISFSGSTNFTQGMCSESELNDMLRKEASKVNLL